MAVIDNTKVVYRGQPTTTLASLYPAAANGEMIKEIICTNTDDVNAQKVTICVVPQGGTAGVANAIAWNKSIPADDFIVLALATDMAVGDFIASSQGVAGKITLTITNYQK